LVYNKTSNDRSNVVGFVDYGCTRMGSLTDYVFTLSDYVINQKAML